MTLNPIRCAGAAVGLLLLFVVGVVAGIVIEVSRTLWRIR